ncbi:DUF4282 domain-containing protein [Corynebacterium camporealensis]
MAENNSEPYSWGIPEEFQQPQQPAQQAEQPQQTDSTTTTTAPNNAPDSNESGVKKFFNRHVRHGVLFERLWDFEFKNFMTIGLVRILYIISIALAVVVWLAFILFTFVAFVQLLFDDFGSGVVMFFLWLLVMVAGWIPAWLWILGSRVFFEGIVALIRIAQNSSDISGQLHNKM